MNEPKRYFGDGAAKIQGYGPLMNLGTVTGVGIRPNVDMDLSQDYCTSEIREKREIEVSADFETIFKKTADPLEYSLTLKAKTGRRRKMTRPAPHRSTSVRRNAKRTKAIMWATRPCWIEITMHRLRLATDMSLIGEDFAIDSLDFDVPIEYEGVPS